MNQKVRLEGAEISFYAGERLRTEYSYKYSLTEFQALASRAGFQTQCVWTDPQQWRKGGVGTESPPGGFAP